MGDTSTKSGAGSKTIGLLLVGCLVGCVGGYGMGKADKSTPSAAQSVAVPAASDTPPAGVAAAVPEPATHRWITHEDHEYGYNAALTDDDKKEGTAVETVHMYRYMGEKDGVYTVVATDNGVPVGRVSCENPCVVAKLTIAGVMQRVTFNPDSLMGAALTDAINGQMEVWRPAPASTADAGQ